MKNVSVPSNLAIGIFYMISWSTRRITKNIPFRLGDSDEEEATGHPTLKVVETGVVTNEGIDTSPAAKHRGDLTGAGGAWT